MNNEFKTNSVPIQWGCNSKLSKLMWLCIPEVGFRVRFSSIDAIQYTEDYVSLIILSGYRIDIFRTEAKPSVSNAVSKIYISYKAFDNFLLTLNNCFSSK